MSSVLTNFFAPNSYVVEYKFELLLANMGLRSEKPFKIVKKEYVQHRVNIDTVWKVWSIKQNFLFRWCSAFVSKSMNLLAIKMVRFQKWPDL